MRVDFHVHSSSSDGTFAPAEIARLAEKNRCAAVALTDHDNIDGVEDFISSTASFKAYSGVELSVSPGEGFDRFHLLAFGVDVKSDVLQAFLGKIRKGRDDRNEQIIANFKAKGIDLESDMRSRIREGVLARPHFARFLVEHGFARSIHEAFQLYLLEDSPKETRCYERRMRPSAEEAFEVIHASGGVAVMAHPKFLKNEWKSTSVDYEAVKKRLAELKEAGLDGLECIYQGNSQEENVSFTMIAEALSLLKSAGSDFHGANKPAVPFGMQVSEPFIMPLIERLEKTI